MKKTSFIITMALMLSTLLVAQTQDNQPLRLKVGTYNVGHFNEGKLGGYQKDDVEDELQRWRNWVGEHSLDILSLNEWNRTFDKGKKVDAQSEILDPVYNNVYFGAENAWIFNGIATNYNLTNIREVKWDGDYYAILGDLKIGEKIITIVSTHIPWQAEWHDRSLNALIEEIKKYEYVICMGDINAKDANQLKFTEAGFNMANGGYQGFFVTAPAGKAKGKTDGIHIDNIITSKNIKILNVKVPETTLTEQDHYSILADVLITW